MFYNFYLPSVGIFYALTLIHQQKTEVKWYNKLMETHEILPFQFIEMSKFIALFAYRKVHK